MGFEPTCAPVLSRLRSVGLEPTRVSQFRHAGMVGSRGFEPRSARSERAASADCATSRDGDHGRIRTATGQALNLLPLPDWATWPIGPSGWTRTITSRVKSPACCVDTTEGGVERMTGFEPVPQGLEGPWATVTPHSLWFGLRVSHPSLHAGNVECILHTQAEHGPVLLTGPSTSFQFSKTPLMRSWWAARDSNPIAPLGENGVTARQRSIRSYRPYGDSARIRTRTHEFWRLGCFRYTTLSTSPHASTVSKTQPPSDLARASSAVQAKQKRPSRGSP